MNLPIPDFSSVCVLVAGDLILDRFWSGKTDRISREFPVPVVSVGSKASQAGGAGNTIMNCAALGAKVVAVGVVGDDSDGEELLGILSAVNVDCSNVQREKDYSTPVKLRISSRNINLLRVDQENTLANEYHHRLAAQLEQRAIAKLSEADVVIISDYGQGGIYRPVELIAAARKKNIPVLVDPQGSDYSRYSGATLLTPNLAEFEEATGCVGGSESKLIEQGRSLIDKLGLTALLITRGENGMTLLLDTHPSEMHFPTQAREVYDVTGAGDTVIAVLATALAAGVDYSRAVQLANLAAGITVRYTGTAPVSLSEIRSELLQVSGRGQGILSQEQLLLMVENAREHSRKIVLSNGCFDIIHAGHIQTLTKAAQLGDRLIVAVNSDASVRRLKGKGRPINSLSRRMAVLSALAVVDWVVSFSEDSPKNLISLLRPDFLVKGGDYQLSQIGEAELVHSYGGKVHVMPLVEGSSTTAISDRLRSELSE